MENKTKWARLFVNNQDVDEFQEALRVEIHDPLWAMARQWQVGEFNAEDSGSPIFAKVHGLISKLNQVNLGEGTKPLKDWSGPLEAVIESCTKIPDLQTKIEMGRHWIRLVEHFKPKYYDLILEKSKMKFSYELPEMETTAQKLENAHLLTNEAYMNLLQLAIKTNMLDGWSIYMKLKSKSIRKIFELPSDDNSTELSKIKNAFLNWYRDRYSQNENKINFAWDRSRNEYRFDLEFGKGKAAKKLNGSEYYHSKLDWYTLDNNTDTEGNIENELDEKSIERTVIPSLVTYPGMPVSRLWEFEDRLINFSNLSPSITNLPLLSLVQFGLVYSNDWFTMPLGNIPDGCLMDLSHIVVKDSFGFQTKIKHYSDLDRTNNWSFFSLSEARHYNKGIDINNVGREFLIPPSIIQNIESRPVEMINFLRDEMANLAWGVEKILPNGILNGKDGDEVASAVKSFYDELKESFSAENAELENDAQIKYLLTTEIPYNWIPFSPVKLKGKTTQNNQANILEIQLRRNAMPRVLVDKGKTIVDKIRPLSQLLRSGFKNGKPTVPLEIKEEEIPRSGTYVRGSWQRTRWHNGEVILWYGYGKTNGRGEENSGLRFDSIIPR